MQKLLNVFKALSDETRLRILKLLENGELCVCDIVAALGMIQPKVSFHLGVMKDAGLIKDRKQGRWIHYRIDDSDIFKRLILISALERIPETAIAEDRKKLRKFLKDKNEKRGMKSKTESSACLCGKEGDRQC
ncbi:MAG TPA: ArsR family transcriptional regulator [Nitrospiraceae bacterium]|nr:MAG: transcriptional regulator [Nitrospirae bacterium GWA2_46_11]HAK88435.1 ArsR family transcriptional regulator [Nitrospiraceae bacterium]HCL80924.1 ArsR family transcriptional regulator [Nitrospiraceae bacterium]HCZ12621.1 ArsR family transcriptional regulator [Nitrospiraceae bacterium]